MIGELTNTFSILFDEQRPCIVEASLKGKTLASYVMNTPSYQVDTGDTLGDIAAMNGVEDPDRQATGMILKLPQ